MSQTLIPTNSTNGSAENTNGTPSLLASASRAKFWRRAAPKKATEAPDTKDSPWQKHLRVRKTLKSTDLYRRTLTRSPLGWGLDREQLNPTTQALLKANDDLLKPGKAGLKGKSLRRGQNAIQTWLKEVQELPQTLNAALASLAVARILPEVASDLDGKIWWHALDALYETAVAASTWQTDLELPPEKTLAQQLVAGELPLTLAYLFPEMKPLHELRGEARGRLTCNLEEVLNGEGLCHGTLLSVWRPLLASWTRSAVIGESFKKNAWSASAAAQYAWSVTQALRWSRADGSQLLSGPGGVVWEKDFIATMLDLAGDAADRSAATESLGKKIYSDPKVKKSAAQPETADRCEWAGLAVLRTDWSRKAARMAVDFSGDVIQLEISAGGRKLFAGPWDFGTEADGTLLRPTNGWEEVCWYSDDEVDYLELSIDLVGGGTLERQVLLARDDDFLLLADNVRRPQADQITHTWSLPLAEEIAFEPNSETREGELVAEKPIAKVLPLALPEWRVDPRGGTLAAEVEEGKATQLTLRQQQPFEAICAPLFIDLNPRRAQKQCTWRQLTVAESLETVSRDVAVAFRVQCGKQQWVAYRSLAQVANRTFIGQNVSSEFFVARFLAPEGESEEMIEIDGR